MRFELFMCLNKNNTKGEDLASKMNFTLISKAVILLLVICTMLLRLY